MKRANGAGTVYQRKDGRWVASTTDPITGKRVTRYANTRNDALAKLRAMDSRKDAGVPVTDARTTVRNYTTWWLEHRAGRNRRASTVAVYRSRLTTHVLPHLGGVQVGAVTVVDVETLLDTMASNGASRYLQRDTRIALSAMFADAVRARMIRSNPAQLAQLPATSGTTARRRRPAPTTDQVKRLLTELAGTELGNLVTVLAHTGARVGEALAAQWTDLDLTNGTWRVWQTVTRDEHGHDYLGGATKTGRTRTLALSPAAVAALTAQRTTVARRRLESRYWENELDLVFPNSVGRIWDSKAARNELRERAPWWDCAPFHGLRYWYATVAITDGTVAVDVVSKVLGHASTRTTRDVYAELMPESIGQVSTVVANALG